MQRDELLVEKDKVQKKLWCEAGRDASAYAALIHEKAKKFQRRSTATAHTK